MSVVGVLPEIRGLGKRSSVIICFIFLQKQNKTVVYHKQNEDPILFSEEGIFRGSADSEFIGYLKNDDTWYIVDGWEPKGFKARTILVCSPQKKYYSAFDKDETRIRYMPVWSWVETDTCRKVIFQNLSLEKVLKLYNKWGGIPRFTLSYTLNTSQRKLLKKAINSVNDKILSFVGKSTEDNSANHKIIHIYTNIQIEEKGEEVPGESSSTVLNVLETNFREQLLNFVTASLSISNYGTLRSAIFERMAHRTLLNGGLFNVRPLSEKATYYFRINRDWREIVPKRSKLLFSNPDEIVQGKYCISAQKNNASFGAFVYPNKFFQMTIAEKHPIVKSDLEKYIDRDDNSDINFYFVLPKELYSSYKEQALHNTNGTVLRNKPHWFNRFKQYALELDLNIKFR
ncbi:3447_t:CDS:2 [Diversispora eburnea]|uniref:3447_t:CDS:1 n=1 Tax=Diversispora eburnea TaxID=1213867 RepID=A0A9N8WK95_9GLOM|nr:3447_t:CDS:2 [Diversispora eburnea]